MWVYFIVECMNREGCHYIITHVHLFHGLRYAIDQNIQTRKVVFILEPTFIYLMGSDMLLGRNVFLCVPRRWDMSHS